MCRGAGSPVRAEIVANRQLTGVDELVIFLSAKGLPHGEINTQLAEVYGSAALPWTQNRLAGGPRRITSLPLDHSCARRCTTSSAIFRGGEGLCDNGPRDVSFPVAGQAAAARDGEPM